MRYINWNSNPHSKELCATGCRYKYTWCNTLQ